MRRITFRLLVSLVLLAVPLSACTDQARPSGPETSHPYGEATQPGKTMVGASADLAVVWINNGCSGVLIGKRTVLTAGHCETPVGSEVVFAQDRSVSIYHTGTVAEAVKMPGWDGPGTQGQLGTTGVDDVQLLRLSEPVPDSLGIDGTPHRLDPIPLNYTAAPVPCGDCIRHVGFGSIVDHQDNTRKNSTVTSISDVTPFKLRYGMSSGGYHGACHGDSGGAGLMRFGADEKLVGVINNGDDACVVESWDTRVDRGDVRGFIQTTLRSWDDCAGHGNCGDMATATIVDDSSPDRTGTQLSYGPHWTAETTDSFNWYDNTTHDTKTKNAQMTVAFSGTAIVVYAMRHRSNGTAAFSVDGGREAEVDLYAAQRSSQQAVFTSSTLPPGNHTLTMRATGTKSAAAMDCLINIDKVAILP